jgi:E3 ubiquitin-protein ligase HERC4
MFGWGVNSHGQLGLGPALVASFVPVPQRISLFDDHICIQVACSLTHSIFLLDDGSVYSTGNNEYLQLGREGRTTIPGRFNQEEKESSLILLFRKSTFTTK